MPEETLSPPHAPTVLIVDDDRMIRLLARRALESVGCRVVEAEDGASAVRTAVDQRPDLVLLDFHLPDVDAPQVLPQLRAISAAVPVPVLLLTASTDPEHLAAARAGGVLDHFAKPFHPKALAERVLSILNPS